MKIDLDRVRRGMATVYVDGVPRTAERLNLIAEAIGRIQSNPQGAFKANYLGIKNYAGFGDQRSDCGYGMGPRHGSIVFEIGRPNRGEGPLPGADAVYALECLRDFGFVEVDTEEPTSYGQNGKRHFNLFHAIKYYDKRKRQAEAVETVLVEAEVDTHEPALATEKP